ncbi:MAG TPA: hypothetical protein DDZ97_06080, partial [Deltaproteobacteria bacterium]|nr:hypothetical protein [Deltaproteobacteria bacterium]
MIWGGEIRQDFQKEQIMNRQESAPPSSRKNIRRIDKESADSWCSTTSSTFQNHDALSSCDSAIISYECVTSAPERPMMIEAAQYFSWD